MKLLPSCVEEEVAFESFVPSFSLEEQVKFFDPVAADS